MKSVRLPLVAIDFFLQIRGKRNSCSSPDPLPAIEEIFVLPKTAISHCMNCSPNLPHLPNTFYLIEKGVFCDLA